MGGWYPPVVSVHPRSDTACPAAVQCDDVLTLQACSVSLVGS